MGQALALGGGAPVVKLVEIVGGEIAGLPAELFALLARNPLCTEGNSLVLARCVFAEFVADQTNDVVEQRLFNQFRLAIQGSQIV